MQTPYLLAAMPELQDEHFHRAIVLVTDHNEKGAFGIVLNAPVLDENLELGLLAGEWVDDSGQKISEFEENIFRGGPMSDDQLFILHNYKDLANPGAHLTEDLFLESDPKSIQKVLEASATETATKRFYVGCSSWGPDQLESEIKAGSWIPLNFRREACLMPFPSNPEEIPAWREKVWAETLKLSGLNPFSLMGPKGSGTLVN